MGCQMVISGKEKRKPWSGGLREMFSQELKLREGALQMPGGKALQAEAQRCPRWRRAWPEGS